MLKKRPDIVNKSQTACLSRKLFPQALTTKTFQTCMSNTMDKAHLHFDATWYLWLYGDVHELIAQGKWSSGLEHYLAIGSKEGRSPNPVMDEGWYLTTYPDVREAVESGDCPREPAISRPPEYMREDSPPATSTRAGIWRTTQMSRHSFGMGRTNQAITTSCGGV